MLDIKNLNVSIKGKRLLHQICLTIPCRQRLGVIGPSGSGKSLLSKAIMNLLPTYSVTCERLKVPQKTTLIQQEPRLSLNPLMRVGKQIDEVTRSKKKTYALLEKLDLLPVEVRYYQYPVELSGGLCQRVNIAMAMAQEPDLILCDEVTTALDDHTKASIIRELDRLSSSLLVITHDWSVIEALCEQVVVVHQGKIVETGLYEDVVKRPKADITQRMVACI